MPSAEVWQEKGLDKYGIIAVGISGESAQVEKVTPSDSIGVAGSNNALDSAFYFCEKSTMT